MEKKLNDRFTVTVVMAVFPAISVAAPCTICPAPAVATATGEGQIATPLRASEHVNVTVTAELFHPSASGGGLIVSEMTGAVLSRFTATDVVAVSPAWFFAVRVMTWFAPFVVTRTGDGQEAIPLASSEHVKLTVTLELFQPAAFG